MTLKHFVENLFTDGVRYNYDNNLFCERDFWSVWDKLLNDIEERGVQSACEWYEDEPKITLEREKIVAESICNYIKKDLQPIFTNR